MGCVFKGLLAVFVVVAVQWVVFFQAEDGIRDLVRSRGLGDVYKRQLYLSDCSKSFACDFVKA